MQGQAQVDGTEALLVQELDCCIVFVLDTKLHADEVGSAHHLLQRQRKAEEVHLSQLERCLVMYDDFFVRMIVMRALLSDV